MSTAALEKRVVALEKEVRTLRVSLERNTPSYHVSAPAMRSTRAAKIKKPKKLPQWLQESLDEVTRGETRGPFETVEELMADLNRPGR